MEFLLAPPREGRPVNKLFKPTKLQFLLAPPREGRRLQSVPNIPGINFYSRPHGRGDGNFPQS